MIGFLNDRDFIPEIYKNLTKNEKFRIFLTLYNANVDDDYKISYSYLKSRNFRCLKDIFICKAEEILREKKLKFYKNVSFCYLSNGIIHAFKNRVEFKSNFSNEPKSKIAKFIKTFYKNGEFELIFDEKELFLGYVYDKISRCNSDKITLCKDGVISVKTKDKTLFNVIPSFKEVDVNDIDKLEDDIKFAFENSSECQVFLVFPRSQKFCKYIDIFGSDLKGRCVRLVPYSVSNKIFIKGKQ